MSGAGEGGAGKFLALAMLVLILFAVALLWWRWPGEIDAGDATAAEDAGEQTAQAAIPVAPAAGVAAGVPASTDAPRNPPAAAPRGATKPFAFTLPERGTAAAECAFPSLAAGTSAFKVYAAGAYSGRRLGMHIDRSGSEAGRIDVAVNRPGEAVALMLGSYDPTVWHVGWSQGTRIVAVLVGGYHRQVVTGLPEEVPLIVSTHDDRGPCGAFYVTAEKAPTLNPIARRAFGQPVAMVHPAHEGRVLIGGPMQAAGALVTDASARDDAAFQVSPGQAGGQAGLAYAVSQGWLREAGQADADAWLAARATRAGADVPPIAGGRPAGRLSMHNAYVVLASFELPPGLTGAHSATFFVPKGVRRPIGDMGHSVLYDFNTLTCAGIMCEQR